MTKVFKISRHTTMSPDCSTALTSCDEVVFGGMRFIKSKAPLTSAWQGLVTKAQLGLQLCPWKTVGLASTPSYFDFTNTHKALSEVFP